jgi:hypothetical protein
MLILHGTYDAQHQQFQIWAEQDSTAVRKKGRQPKIPVHPFSVSAEVLIQHLTDIAPHIMPEPSSGTIWLPSVDHSPQPSPDLAATGAIVLPENASLRLEAWRVERLTLSVSNAVDLLLAMNEHILNSADMRYWHTLTMYALDLKDKEIAFVGCGNLNTVNQSDLQIGLMPCHL